MWGATCDEEYGLDQDAVSIHAPRVGCDIARPPICCVVWRFNSRTPCGVRHYWHLSRDISKEFQFTHPVWGATKQFKRMNEMQDVSIHAPRVGCDWISIYSILLRRCFNSRTPCGVRLTCNRQVTPRYVSIHAPRVGCDVWSEKQKVQSDSFNSRTPCGVRRLRHPSRATL